MKLNSEQTELLATYMVNEGQPLVIVTDEKGKIESINKHLSDLLGEDIVGKSFCDIILDFNDSFSFEECLVEKSKKKLLNLSIHDDYPRSYYFRFITSGNKTIIIGEIDAKELEILKEQLLTVNRDLSNMTRELHKNNSKLQKALDEVKTLKGFIPICMHCKQIRNDQGYWKRLEEYIESHSEAQFSHSICDECLDIHYPEDD